jgi:hypothetical protein
MKEMLKIVVILLFLSLITFSSISVFAENAYNSNQTNSTNDTNVTNKTTNATVTNNAVIQPMSLYVSLTISPSTTVNFGTLTADGTEHTFTGATTAHVTSWLGNGGLYVRSSGNLISSTNSIPLINLKYDCPGYASKTQFSTTDSLIDQYNSGLFGYDYTYTMNYYLTVPTGTYPGTYNTTIIYTAT